MGMIRSMLLYSGLFKLYWAEAAVTVIYLLNRVVITVLSGKIFYEVFWGRKLSFLYLKVFGFSVFVFISEVKRKKLDDRFRQLVFVGYSEESKVYKLFDSVIFKIILFRSVIFKEFVFLQTDMDTGGSGSFFRFNLLVDE